MRVAVAALSPLAAGATRFQHSPHPPLPAHLAHLEKDLPATLSPHEGANNWQYGEEWGEEDWHEDPDGHTVEARPLSALQAGEAQLPGFITGTTDFSCGGL